MLNLNGYIGSGSFTGSSPIPLIININPDLERRLDELDDKTRKEVRKHIDEFHSKEEMEMFINMKLKENAPDQAK